MKKMKNDEMVTDANMLVTQNTITQDQIEEVNIYLEYEEGSRLLTNLGYSYYYNLMQQNMHPADADRYANLNTILGYDVGKNIFTAIDSYVWEHDYDLLELSGSGEDKKILEDAAEKLQISLDFSKWKNLSGQQYDYLFFEEEGYSGSDNFENGNSATSKIHTFTWKYDIHNQSDFDKVIADIGKKNSTLNFITVARLIYPDEIGAAMMVQLEVPTSRMRMIIKENLPLLNHEQADGLWLAAYTLIDINDYDETIPVSCMNYYRKITYENAEELMLKYAKLIDEN